MPYLLFKVEGEEQADRLTEFAFTQGLAIWKMEASQEKAEEIERERAAGIRAWVNELLKGGR